jgi:dihydrofolate reductase
VKIVIIVGISRNNIIGDKNGMPWHYAADFKHFRRTTRGCPFVVGRKTFESFQVRPLPGRLNIVLTRNAQYQVPKGVLVFSELAETLTHCRSLGTEKLFVLGGAQIYRQALPLTDEMVITHIPKVIDGDTSFPAWDKAAWQIVDKREEDGLSFITYARIKPA